MRGKRERCLRSRGGRGSGGSAVLLNAPGTTCGAGRLLGPWFRTYGSLVTARIPGLTSGVIAPMRQRWELGGCWKFGAGKCCAPTVEGWRRTLSAPVIEEPSYHLIEEGNWIAGADWSGLNDAGVKPA